MKHLFWNNNKITYIQENIQIYTPSSKIIYDMLCKHFCKSFFKIKKNMEENKNNLYKLKLAYK